MSHFINSNEKELIDQVVVLSAAGFLFRWFFNDEALDRYYPLWIIGHPDHRDRCAALVKKILQNNSFEELQRAMRSCVLMHFSPNLEVPP